MRGGSYGDPDYQLSTFRNYLDPTAEAAIVGFRLASVVPEPAPITLTLLSSGVLLFRRKRWYQSPQQNKCGFSDVRNDGKCATARTPTSKIIDDH
jgi:hypothetical protein